jgi:hypothetical protein
MFVSVSYAVSSLDAFRLTFRMLFPMPTTQAANLPRFIPLHYYTTKWFAITGQRDSAVGTVTRHRNVGRCGLPRVLFNGYRELFSRGNTARAWGRPITAKHCLLRRSILGRYSTKKLSRHDSVALSGELEARKRRGANYVRCLSFPCTTNMVVTSTPI